jgi:hypothetical protein
MAYVHHAPKVRPIGNASTVLESQSNVQIVVGFHTLDFFFIEFDVGPGNILLQHG